MAVKLLIPFDHFREEWGAFFKPGQGRSLIAFSEMLSERFNKRIKLTHHEDWVFELEFETDVEAVEFRLKWL